MSLEEIGIRTLFKLTALFAVVSLLGAVVTLFASRHLDKVYGDILELLKDREA